MLIQTAFKFSLLVVIFGGVAIGMEPSPEVDFKTLLYIGLYVAGMIGVAAVLRSDVSDLKKWKNRHDDKHDELTEILTELKTISKVYERRLEKLEDHPHECENFKPPHGRE